MMQKYTKSISSNLSSSDLWIIAAAVSLMVFIYLLASKLVYGMGFPLDDAWIHQTYARNLATYGEWAFRPGVKSAGSTSPLWSVLLSIGFLLGLSPYIWTYILGGLIIFSLAVVSESAARNLLVSYQPKFPWVALFMVFEWHLSWAAMSGMETLLHGLIITIVLVMLMTGTPRYLTLGLLTGLATWVRPDGLTLIGPVFMVIVFVEKDNASKFKAMGRFLIGFGSLFIPYLLFNLYIGGTPMPNTFYAKQAEYAEWQNKTILFRLNQLSIILAGSGIALLPGVIIWIIFAVKEKAWGNISVFIWYVGFIFIYIMRMPTYQHGRYTMPAMPIFFLTGILAILHLYNGKLFGRYQWMFKTFWSLSIVLLLVAFIFVGANAYAQDVAIIESEMVVTAKWVAKNTSKNSVLAVHDIGAMGYFDNHTLIDLAGLISPETIPFIRDEARISAYLDEQGVNYLVAFPDIYPQLTQSVKVVFITDSQFTASAGEKSMTVYLWKTP